MRKIVVGAVVTILLCLAAYFGSLAYIEYKPIMRAEKQKETLIEAVTDEDDPNDPLNRVIDWETLKNINEDVVGWIYIPDSSINYPILVGATDTQYLNMDIERNKSSLGSIFSYADTSRNLTDARTVLFGHNMRDFQMFGELKQYLDDDFRNEHTKMYIYTEERTLELAIYSIFVCKETDNVLWDNVELGTIEYQELLQELADRNEYPDISTDVADSYNEQTFSLVTCKGRQGTSDRLVISFLATQE